MVLLLCGYAGGSLYWLLHEQRAPLLLRQRLAIALHFVAALQYLHCRPIPIVHRDIKSLNIVVSKEAANVVAVDSTHSAAASPVAAVRASAFPFAFAAASSG